MQHGSGQSLHDDGCHNAERKQGEDEGCGGGWQKSA